MLHSKKHTRAKVQIIQGDCREELDKLPACSLHTIVTSPPYWNLRDYGTAQWTGGDPDCEHRHIKGGHGLASKKQITQRGGQAYQFKSVCKLCGAVRHDQQIGMESTPIDYINNLLKVFTKAWRVLRDDGTIWINIGDSYAGSGGGDYGTGLSTGGSKEKKRPAQSQKNVAGIKPKDLVGIPWMLAFALRNAGWYWRQTIIWDKPNPMTESMKDRCTNSHEYILFFSKSEKYYYDQEAIKEPTTSGNVTPRTFGKKGGSRGDEDHIYHKKETRIKRSVWRVPAKPIRESHFATFPPALIRPCILAGCPAGGTVLDPFGGSGTTGMVAAALERNAILIELNGKDYIGIQHRRVAKEAPLFMEII